MGECQVEMGKEADKDALRCNSQCSDVGQLELERPPAASNHNPGPVDLRRCSPFTHSRSLAPVALTRPLASCGNKD